MRNWAVQYLPSVVESLTPFTYNQKVAGSNQPYLVDFYAPCMFNTIVTCLNQIRPL